MPKAIAAWVGLNRDKGAKLIRKQFASALASMLVIGAAWAATAYAIPGDGDDDGIADSQDRCALVAGVEQHLGCPRAVVVNTKITRPDRTQTVRIKGWEPWATPTVSQVFIIMRAEQRRWGGPSLSNRIACESGYSWAASNGQYAGLLQFGSIWSSMWAGTPRGVNLTTTVKFKRPVSKWSQWSDGRWTSQTLKRVTVRKRIIRKGKLPRYPDAYHGWAAIRVGQRAVSGDGPTTSWACGL